MTALIKRNPSNGIISTDPFARDTSLIDLFFKDFFDNSISRFGPLKEAHINAPINIYDDDKGLTYEIAIPGIEKDQIEISTENGILRVKHSKSDEQSIDRKYRIRKIASRSFDYGWKIDPIYNIEDIKAKIKNGLLTIFIPISENVKPVTIEIEEDLG